jgi:hypothetical protein
MIFAADIVAMKAALILVSGAAGGDSGMTCSVKTTPAVKVTVETDQIDYDFTKSAQHLSSIKNDTVSPYAPGTDTVSGGLREDHPQTRAAISWSLEYNPDSNIGCMWYDKVEITVRLDPKIYVAKEFNVGNCREAILAHERRHVSVDREVMNKYASNMGRAVQKAIDQAGAMGPFNMNDQKKMQDLSSQHIENAMKPQRLAMEKEMRTKQAQVDSLAEYERVSAYCRNVLLNK